MTDTRLIGVCKKEISEMLPVFSDRLDFQEEYKISIGQTKHIYANHSYVNGEKDEYYFFLQRKKIEMTREQIEENFDVTWERYAYNTCIREGMPCRELRGIYRDGETSLCKRGSSSCRINFEIGRGDCYRYRNFIGHSVMSGLKICMVPRKFLQNKFQLQDEVNMKTLLKQYYVSITNEEGQILYLLEPQLTQDSFFQMDSEIVYGLPNEDKIEVNLLSKEDPKVRLLVITGQL